MPISHSRRGLFVHVPKTGGTSVEVALGMHGPWQDENRDILYGLVRSEDLLERRFGSAFLQHLTIHELREVVTADAANPYFSFSFVRNPWDRMVSVYHRTDPHLRAHARGLGVELAGLSFPEFLARTEGLRHAHLRDQADYICDDSGRTVVDFVGRFETLAADFKTVCNRLQTEAALPHVNVSTHEGYRSYYDEASRALVERRFLRDVDLFGYRF